MPSYQFRDLLAEIEQGRYAVPEIQRPYVWRNSQVKELFESIYRQFPIGSIIMWEPAREVFEKYEDLFRPLSGELEDKKRNFKYVVIDGQQRLLSLLLVKRGRITVVDALGHQQVRMINLYYNADNDEFFYDRARREYEKDPYVYRVSDILDYIGHEDVEELVEAKGLGESTQKKEISKRLKRVRDAILNYPINIYLIPESALKYRSEGDEDNFLEIFEKMSQMFVRLNYTGTRVKMPHLMMALLTGKMRKELGISFGEKLSEVVSQLEEIGWDIGESTLMRTYLAISTGETKFNEGRKRLNELSARKIEDYLEKFRKSLEYTIKEVLILELNIKKPEFLKSEYAIVPITYYAYIKNNALTPSEVKSVARWLILASFNRRYTGRLESDLFEDIRALATSKDINTLVKNLQTTQVQKEWLDKPMDKEHLTMLSILLRDSYDLMKGVTVKLKNVDSENIHIHHIFPKKQIEMYYKEYIEDIEAAYDHMANITLISDKANESIKDKRPDEYLSEIDPEILKSHMIPLNEELWKLENYPKFLEERKKLIMKRVSELFKS